MKKKMAAISMAMALILGLTACGAANGPVPSETAAVPAESAAPSEAAAPEPAASEPAEADPRAGKLIWSTPQSLTSADAYMWDVSGDIQIHVLCIEGLMEHVGWNQYEPALATNWDISDDLLTYTFHLREGVKFHSGDDFSAEDVVWSADRLKNMPAGSVAGHLSTLEACTAIDANTVEMKFSDPNPMIFFDLAYLKIYSKAQAERDGENFYEKFVGTGPWKLQEWNPGESISFERNSDWWGTFADGAPTVIEHRPIPEESTRLAALLSGEIDLIPMVPVESQPLITETDYLYTESLSGINVVDLVMKNDKAPFNTTQMRQAMDLMVPREQIVSDLLGQGTPANIWSQSFYAWYPTELEGVIKPYDIEQAKALIAQSGYNGEEIRIMTRRGKSEKDVEMCELLSGIWNQAGLNVTVQVVADAEFTERRASGDYEIYMTAWDINSPGFYYRDKYEAHNINRADVDPKFVELVEAVCAEMNIDEYNKKVAELERYLYEDPATLHLYYPAITWGAANRVESFESVGGYIHLRLHNTVMAPAAR